MKIDHNNFLELCGNFNTSQKQGMDFLITSIENDPAVADIRWAAYMLATIDRECAGTWQPIAEYGKGAGRPYGANINGHAYYGRGYVQLTWIDNYKSMSAVTGVDLVSNPDAAMHPDVAYEIMSHGMIHGSFTGVGLPKYINADKCDYINARRIINGVDHAVEIAKAAEWLEHALTVCEVA